jgi:hypothetical protein
METMEMKERNPDVDIKEDTKGMPRKKQSQNQVYEATHGPKMEEVGNLLCPFCKTDLSVDHILREMQRN